MHRFYVEQLPGEAPPEAGSSILLPPEEARHAHTVLRLRTGARVELICDGRRLLAEVEKGAQNAVALKCLEPLPSTEPSLAVTLFQGLPKGDKMDMVVQKATELGAVCIVPVLMNRCVARPSEKDLKKRQERWTRIAREAAKQSGRCCLPRIEIPLELSRLGEAFPLPQVLIAPWEEASGFGPRALFDACPHPASLGILIGPEGGIEPAEMEQLKAWGFLPFTLGKRILRTETAGLAALAAVMSLYGEME